jgi:hypothetical protein
MPANTLDDLANRPRTGLDPPETGPGEPPPPDCQQPKIVISGSSCRPGDPIFSWSPNVLARVLQAFWSLSQISQKSLGDPIERQGTLLYKHPSRFTAKF